MTKGSGPSFCNAGAAFCDLKALRFTSKKLRTAPNLSGWCLARYVLIAMKNSNMILILYARLWECHRPRCGLEAVGP